MSAVLTLSSEEYSGHHLKVAANNIQSHPVPRGSPKAMDYTSEPEELNIAPKITTKQYDAHGNPAEWQGTGEVWGAKEWTQSIVRRPFVQESKKKLDIRLCEFLAAASPADRKRVEDGQKKVLEIMQDAQKEHKERYPPNDPESDQSLAEKFKEGCKRASETAYEYSKILDVMVGQAPEYVGLAYGAIKILLVVQVNYEEMKQNVDTYMSQIKAKFDNINHLTTYVPLARLVTAIAEIYDYFYRFLAKAVKFYTGSKLKNSLKAFAKPWKRLEPLVMSINLTYTNIESILAIHSHFISQQSLGINLANLAINKGLAIASQDTSDMMKQLRDMMESMSVKMSKESDVKQIADLLRQRLDEKSDNPAKSGIGFEIFSTETGNESGGTNPAVEDETVSQRLKNLFVDLQEFDEALMEHESIMEERPEMRHHRSKKKNVCKTDQVIAWLESGSSEILWIDGNNNLSRFHFNAYFTIPLLISGSHNFEDIIILRHFCGHDNSLKSNSYRTLVQALLNQLLKKRGSKLASRIASLTPEQANNLEPLWTFFIKCLEEVNANCTFIVIDSIDHVKASNVSGGFQEGKFVLGRLNDLIENGNVMVKVLLTAHLSQEEVASAEGEKALLTVQSTDSGRMRSVPFTPQRKLSLAPIQDEMALVPRKFIEIQEGRCLRISFTQLTMLYPLKTTMYTWEEGHLRAFVITELSGMQPRSFGTYMPLQIRAWSVDHNGRYFTKKQHDFEIAQFSGERAITSLRCIPSGYLPEEASHRAKLIARGRRYWTLGTGVHYKQCRGEQKESVRIIIDQVTAALEKASTQEIADQFEVIQAERLKPLTLMLCPPKLSAYILADLIWSIVDVDDIEDLNTTGEALDQLVLPEGHKDILHALVASDSQASQQPGRPRKDFNIMPDTKDVKVKYDRIGGPVILLHGAPGVGKTATAICMSDLLQKPLILITIGQMGNTPKDIDLSLRESFKLARKWDAIVLLDDADVFLSSRSRGDVNGNSVVAVAMRALEHYTGVVFLTTNRVGEFDEAFQSRIHLSLYYPPIDERAYAEIWKQLLSEDGKLSRDRKQILRFLLDTFKDRRSSGTGAMNGREIKNVFATAQQLALWEGATLSTNHFSHVLKATGEFHQYLTTVNGAELAKIAMQNRLRRDDFNEYMVDRTNKRGQREKWRRGESSDVSDSSSNQLSSDSDEGEVEAETVALV